MHDVRVSMLGLDDCGSHTPGMQNAIKRPTMGDHDAREVKVTRAAQWVVDALAFELAAEPGLDREALVTALARRAGYAQADSLWPDAQEELQAGLVARLADRLVRD